MRGFHLILRGFLLLSLLAAGGCGQLFTPSPPPPRETRTGDYYVKKYAERELRKHYSNEAGGKVEVKKIRREGNDFLADIIVTTPDGSVPKQVVINEKGKVLRER